MKYKKQDKKMLNAYLAGNVKSTLTPMRIGVISRACEAFVKKDKRINIRITSRDLEAIQRKAMTLGIPYQTMIASVLHKYFCGSVIDLTEVISSKDVLK